MILTFAVACAFVALILMQREIQRLIRRNEALNAYLLDHAEWIDWLVQREHGERPLPPRSTISRPR